ncbi:major facilitator superfamily domain-containing protein [Dichotomocladium elegans]|nr:major facilitator superfamily domain-containing protein [Dichotomocladium elegans]
MFVTALNTTVIAPAMTRIATDLGAPDQLTWIATAYLLAFVTSQGLAGKFSDIFGRKPIYLFGIFLFVLGSIVNAVTQNMPGMIAGRTVQGLGAGSIMAMSFVLVADLVPVEKRPRFQSALSVNFGLANVVGTLIGGVFVQRSTWRWDFWFNVILGGIAFIIIILLLEEPLDLEGVSFREKFKRIDIAGTFLLIAFVCCLLLGLCWGRIYGWSSGHAIGPFVAAGVSLIVLGIVESKFAKEPVIPLELLGNPAVSIFYLYVFCFGLGFVATLYYSPILYQSVFGADSIDSGVRLVPYMCSLIISSVGSGYFLSLIPYVKLYIVIGSIFNIIGFGLFWTVNEQSNWGQQACYLMFCGFSFGLSQQNCLFGVQTAAPKKYIAVATGLNQFSLMLSCAIGVAISDTLYREFLKDQLMSVSPDVLAIASQYGATSNYLFIRNMPVEIQQPIIHAYMVALNKMFIMPLVVAGIAVVCALLAKNVRYGSPQSQQQNHKEPMAEKSHANSGEGDDASSITLENFREARGAAKLEDTNVVKR